MIELMSMNQEENETLQEFIKKYHHAVLDLRAFNHSQALKGLKERVRIGRLWYIFRSTAVQSYFVAYEKANKDIEIEEEKLARIKSEQLQGLRRKEKKVPGGRRPIKRKDHHAQGISAGNRITSYQIHQRPSQFQHNRIQPPRSPTRDSWGRPNQRYSHPYHHAPITHHSQNIRASGPNPLILAPIQTMSLKK